MVSFTGFVSVSATAASICMVGAPVVTVRKMEKQRSVGAMTPLYFSAQLASCAVWSIYGVMQDAFGVILCNAIGNAIATYCLLVFLSVARREEKSGHRIANTTYKKSQTTVMIAISFIACASLLIVCLASVKPPAAKTLNGLLGSCCSVFMLSSPLALAGAIIKNKNAEGLAPLTITFALANTSLWCLYALLKRDIFIFVPNLLGIAACLFQFLLFFMYGQKPAKAVAVKAAVAPLPFSGD
ncbi:solute carrier family 50 (sugar transporter) [Trypanosoma grayi]|uniref:solute carrier family 50 (sugar transporter) n=1 Tax=Trypanosoma grayi TaxID=71804 RepID=UPI0004F40B91|nr:solute carrier family 50 (sugar transporter) [Trypanosoma grayi]KEG12831.1 solute carrier family 50 (sugar transporter) [Trypanosoma grayi]